MKLFKKLICTYTLYMLFFGKRKLAKKISHKMTVKLITEDENKSRTWNAKFE